MFVRGVRLAGSGVLFWTNWKSVLRVLSAANRGRVALVACSPVLRWSQSAIHTGG